MQISKLQQILNQFSCDFYLDQESVRALDLTILKLFLWFYFSKRLSVATLF